MYAPSLWMTVLARCKLWLSLLAVVPCLIDVPHLQFDVPWLLCQIQQLHFFGEVRQLQIHFLQLQSEVFVLSSVVLSLPAMCFHCMARCCSFRSSYRHPQCQIEAPQLSSAVLHLQIDVPHLSSAVPQLKVWYCSERVMAIARRCPHFSSVVLQLQC